MSEVVPQWWRNEQMRKAQEQHVNWLNGALPQQPLTEDRIRAIVREEIANALDGIVPINPP